MAAKQATSIRQLAKAVGRSRNAIDGWLKHPQWDQGRSPPWDIGKAKAWAARTLQPDRATGQHGPTLVPPPDDAAVDPLEGLRRSPITAAKLKLTLTRTSMLQLQQAILSGEYVPRADVEAGLIRRAYTVRAAFEALPRQLAGVLAGQDEATIEQTLEQAIANVLTEMSHQPNLLIPPNKEVAQ